MTRKQLTYLILSLVILILGAFAAAYYFLNQKGDAPITNTPTTTPTTPRQTLPRPNPTQPTNPGNQTPGIATSTTSLTPDNIPRVRKLSEGPVAGYISYLEKVTEEKRQINKTYIRFFEKRTSGISQATASSTAIEKLANVDIPANRVGEVVWNQNGKSFFMRYPDSDESIQTLYAELLPRSQAGRTSTTTNSISILPFETKNTFLPKNISFLVPTKAGTSVVYGISNNNNLSVYSAKTDLTQRRLAWSYPISEWQVQNPSASDLFLTTKPSVDVFGYHYSLNVGTGVLTRLFGDINGLTTLVSPKGDKTLLSAPVGSSFDTSVYTKSTGQFERFPISTLTEKCVWSAKEKSALFCAIAKTIPQGNYPDDWYQGNVSFSDEIWKIDLESGSTKIYFTPEKEVGQRLDMVNLSVTPEENELLFQNKTDGGTLWILRLNEGLLNNSLL